LKECGRAINLCAQKGEP